MARMAEGINKTLEVNEQRWSSTRDQPLWG